MEILATCNTWKFYRCRNSVLFTRSFSLFFLQKQFHFTASKHFFMNPFFANIPLYYLNTRKALFFQVFLRWSKMGKLARYGLVGSLCLEDRWVKVFKNGPSKICGRKPLKNLKWYGVCLDCLPQILLGPFLNILIPRLIGSLEWPIFFSRTLNIFKSKSFS